MSEPTRLFEHSDEARLLLGSARDDAPSAEARQGARQAALASLGLAAGSGALLTAGTGKAAGKVVGAVALKWLLAMSVPVGAAALAYVVSSTTATPAPPLAAPPRSVLVAPAPPTTTPAPVVVESAPVLAPSAAAARPAERPMASLQAEITELDAARLALAHGDISVLDKYLQGHPKGALREQALWMKVSHLDRSGQRAQARAAAQRFVAAYPNSAYAARARRLAAP